MGETDIMSILFPIFCCLFAYMLSLEAKGQRSQPTTETDLWFTTQNIKEAYEAIVKETSEWRRRDEEMEARPKSSVAKLKSVFGRRKRRKIFVVQEAVAPRLYELVDSVAGPVYFELTEVEGGGTVVKATHSPLIKDRIVNFKVHLPLKIPATPIGNHCPSCGKPVLREFNVCPYCGQKLISW